MAGKEPSRLSRRVDQICRVLFLTEEGRPKSAFLLYSFCLALLYLIVTFAAYFLLIDVLEGWFAGAGVQIRNVLETVVPGVLVSIPCAALSYAFKTHKNMVPAAYGWMALILLLITLLQVAYCDWSEGATDWLLYWKVFGLPMLVSIVCGGGISYGIYRSRTR